jgi:hypothetical protein
MKLTKQRYVYFMRPIGGDGRIKIGCSYVPARRLVELARHSAYLTELVAVAPGDFSTERALHDFFAADRLHSEWFRSSPELLRVIDLMSRGVSFADATAPELARAA